MARKIYEHRDRPGTWVVDDRDARSEADADERVRTIRAAGPAHYHCSGWDVRKQRGRAWRVRVWFERNGNAPAEAPFALQDAS